MDDKRAFNNKQKTALYLYADGKCTLCGKELEKDWHADHIQPYSKNGKTDVINGQALCPECNLKKGNKFMELWKWQKDFIKGYWATDTKDFLLMALPAGGKTYATLYLANQMMENSIIDKVIIVVPTLNLKQQWATEAHKYLKMELDYEFKSKYNLSKSFDGIILTYNQAYYENDELYRRILSDYKTLVVFDEIHHCGTDSKWGKKIEEMFRTATKRLCLTGTPFRSDRKKIPFVKYYDGVCVPDYTYDYPNAIRDNVVRIANFKFYDGDLSWSDNGDIKRVRLEDNVNKKDYIARKKIALNPHGDYFKSMFKIANNKIDEIRNEEEYNAGGIIIATHQDHARKIVDVIKKLTNEKAILVISEESKSIEKINIFRNSNAKWIVAVKMISEGVDIKRLRVMLWMTNVETDLYFRQVVGRVVRHENKNDIFAFCYLPNIKNLKEFADRITEMQIQAVKEEEEKEKGKREQNNDMYENEIILLSSSEAENVYTSVDGLGFTTEQLNKYEMKAKKYGVLPEVYASMRTDILNDIDFEKEMPIEKKEKRQITLKEQVGILRKEINRIAYIRAMSQNKEVREIHILWLKDGGKRQGEQDIDDLNKKLQWLSDVDNWK